MDLTRPEQPKGLVVAMHGLPGAGSDWVRKHGAVGAALTSGLAIVGVDGSESWWHSRHSGTDAGTDYQGMILDDLLPAVAARGFSTARIGLLGLSMGGYGALLLAERLGVSRCFGVATMSAAVYRTFEEAHRDEETSFDDPADFAAHDILGAAERLAGLPVWLAAGTRDGFLAGNQALASRVTTAVSVFDDGAHDLAYWSGHIGAAAHFLAAHAPK